MCVGGCHCKVSALGPGVTRDSALAHDTEEAGVEKAWTPSQRLFAHLEMCSMLPTAQGTQCWSLSLWLQCPQSHSRIYTKVRTPVAQRGLLQPPSRG